MTLLLPRARKSPGPCPVCGKAHSSCVGSIEDPIQYPEIIDQRFRDPWRFKSIRDVRKKMGSGRMILMWKKGMPIPPEEALRQGVIEFDGLTYKEQQRVFAYIERRKQGLKGAIAR